MPAPKRVFVFDKKSKRIVQVDGPERTHSPTGRRLPMVNNAYSKRPVESLGLSVHPNQVADMRQRVREAGASQGCSVAPDGTVKFTSRKARKNVLRHVGMHDRDGGYSD